MPLRRIPGLGSRALRALTPSLESACGKLAGKNEWWTCRDLLRIPRPTIVEALSRQDTKSSCGLLSDVLLQRCYGIDPALVVDDDGGLPKTVSVEESFRRGTCTERRLVELALHDLFVRLSKLLDERKLNSVLPNHAYPRSLRVSVRLVDKSLKVKRPFVSSSKQCSFNGNSLLRMNDRDQRVKFLWKVVSPLLGSLLPEGASQPVDLTKLNIAATNFGDVSHRPCGEQQQSVSQFFAPIMQVPSKNPLKTRGEQPLEHLTATGAVVEKAAKSSVRKKEHSFYGGKRASAHSILPTKRTAASCGEGIYSSSEIDPQVLSELPADIAAEIVESYKLNASSKKVARHKGIASFFNKKS
mmetsp:Transcript_32120/g.96247  ORF Transcript_32120/g.96247 Transcript_32120/m.96247 type:complete len:356 (+) Transcript_32120:1304-2371(+)